MNCPKCGSRIVSYEGKDYCLRCPAEKAPAEKILTLKIVIAEDVPTEIEYWNNTNIIRYKKWKNANGLYHKDDDKPAYVVNYSNGGLWIERFYMNGMLHRLGGKPAEVCRRDGIIYHVEYWVNGIRVQ